MKKLQLKLDGIKEMLTKDQMKKINGGYNGMDTRCAFQYTVIINSVAYPIYTEWICAGIQDVDACAAICMNDHCDELAPDGNAPCSTQDCYVF